jgi:hypothetical protein
LPEALRASRRSSAPFDYLLKTAMRESGLDAGATARTSSATGLFQFVEQTWLELVKEEGPRLGLAAEAAQIERTARGTCRVTDPQARHDILALRKNPGISAAMAGEFARRNAVYLNTALGRQPTEGELYIAHFLGAGGAVRLIRHAAERPDAAAADLFPAQAATNRAIFYRRDGHVRSVGAVYANLVSRHGDGPLPASPADSPARAIAYAPTQPADWAQSAAAAIRGRFSLVEPDETAMARREIRQPEAAGLPSRFALAALQSKDDADGEAAAVPRLRPAPGSDWSDEGPIEPTQLLPIAGRRAAVSRLW